MFGAPNVYKMDPDWGKDEDDALGQFSDTVYPDGQPSGMTRVGEQKGGWHENESEYRGGHLVYRINPEWTGSPSAVGSLT